MLGLLKARASIAVLGLSVGWLITSAAPEDDVAKINLARQNLLNEIGNTRAEAASAGADLTAAIKARDLAEAERTRLMVELAATEARLRDELSKAQAEAASVGAELAAAIKARDLSEAERTRLTQEIAATESSLREELVKARAEAASVAAELADAIKARDLAEAKLARLAEKVTATGQVGQSANLRASVDPQEKATDGASGAARDLSADGDSPSDAQNGARSPRKAAVAPLPPRASSGPRRSIVRTAASSPRGHERANRESPSQGDWVDIPLDGWTGWTGKHGGYGEADGTPSHNGPGFW